jgi:acyl transferase domain-containing protein
MSSPASPSPSTQAGSPAGSARQALQRLQTRLAELEARVAAPIAIVGISCRLPGGVSDAESYWSLLRDGRDAVGPIPKERWDADACFDADPQARGKSYQRHGGFVDGIDQFDAALFDISPREAAELDPQQRMLLEESWAALEDAGHLGARLAGSRSGVFVGLATNDYALRHMASGDPERIGVHSLTGSAGCIASGRIAYALGLHGPAVTVDTACSSSLMAVHLACQSLRAGECDLALVGGVNALLDPALSIYLSRARALSPSGRCRAFAAAADGFVRSEGCAVIVLRRLDEALADGDRVRAVIRGSAANNDGRSNGLTAPNGVAQERLLVDALRAARVAPDEIGYLEAHGTGTPLGDPIEFGAIAAVFGARPASVAPLALGSVKTNLGHLEAASGIAGLIKLALLVERGALVPHLHLDAPSPHLGHAEARIDIPTENAPWPAGYARRIGGVSSFGFSGTNVHVVVEEPPAPAAVVATAASPSLLMLSARSQPALQKLAARHQARLADDPSLVVGDVAHSANTGRLPLDVRAAVVATTREELARGLFAIAGGAQPGSTVTTRPRVAFLFGDGDASAREAVRALVARSALVRSLLERIDRALADHGQPALLASLDGDEPHPRAPLWTLALQLLLVELWRAWGVTPSVVLGHGAGEYAAACAADLFDVEAALALLLGAPSADGMRVRPPRLSVFSSAAAGAIRPDELGGASEWRQRLQNLARLDEAVRAALAGGVDALVEIGPDGALLTQAQRLADDGARLWLPSLQPGRDALETMLAALGALFVRGADVDADGLARERGGFRRVALPTYPFERRRHFLPPAQPRATPARPWHQLLRVDSPAIAGALFTTELALEEMPLVADHVVGGGALVNLVVYLTLATEAFAAATGRRCRQLDELFIARPLVLAAGERHAVQVLLTVGDDGAADVRIVSRRGDEAGAPWLTQVRTTARAEPSEAAPPLAMIPAVDTEPLDLDGPAGFYATLARRGVALGPACRGLEALARHGEHSVGLLRDGATPRPGEPVAIPLALVDGAFQATMAPHLDDETPRVIVGFRRLQLDGAWRDGRRVVGEQRLDGDGGASARFTLFDERGAPLVRCDGIRYQPLAARGDRPTATPPPTSPTTATAAPGELGLTLAALPADERAAAAERALAQILGDVLQLDAGALESLPLARLGVDSFMAMELAERVEQVAGVRLSLLSILQDATLSSLATEIAQRASGADGPVANAMDEGSI